MTKLPPMPKMETSVKITIKMEIEPDNYTSVNEMLDAVRHMLRDHRWSKLAWAKIIDDNREVDIFIIPETVEVREVRPRRPR